MFSLAFRSQVRLLCRSTVAPGLQRSTPRPRVFRTTPLRNFSAQASETTSTESLPPKKPLKQARPEEPFQGSAGNPPIWRQLIFVGLLSSTAFAYAASRTNIETEYWKRRLENMSTTWQLQTISSLDLKRVQNAELIRQLREWMAGLNQRVQDMPALIRPWISVAVVSVLQPYADASEGKRLCWKICLLNAGVYLAWKIRRFQPAMAVRFMHTPLSGLSYTLLTSMFSHKGFFHLLLNCLALESFGSAAYFYLMREQAKSEPPMLESTGAFHFLAFFISAGLFSGLVSHVATAKLMYPRLVRQFSSQASKPKYPETVQQALTMASATPPAGKAAATGMSILPSLGASGAVYAAVTMTALAFPESEIALFIPPSYPLNIQYGVGGLVALDMIGIIRGWRTFDHWAHLGGAAFGVFYYAYGPDFWTKMRRTFALPTRSD